MGFNPDAVMAACVGTFGEAVEYRPASGSAYAAKGIFNAKSIGINVTTGAEVLMDRPTLGVRLSDFSAGHPKQNDEVYVQSTVYRIDKVEGDGEAGAVLVLRKPVPDDPSP